ncbi:MAG: hypothetical protein ACYDHZ_00550 [Dehalococcoidia bacterium]
MEESQERSLMYVDPSAVAAAETSKARIQSAYVMAYKKPRSQDQARINILAACRRPMFAERVEYAKPVGGRSIKGPSVRFAELALREWGNVLIETQVLYEDPTIRRTRITVIDLETNSTFSKDVQIAKTVERKQATPDREIVGSRQNTQGQTVYIVTATEEELHNKEAAAISKAIRNEGLRLIPSDIVDEAMEEARQTLRNRDKGDPAAAKKRILDSFATIGVKPKNLEQYLGHGMDTISPAELEDLRKVFQAIKDGESTWADYVSAYAEDPENPSKLKTQSDAIKDKLKRDKNPPKPPQDAPVVETKAEGQGNGKKPVVGITDEQRTYLGAVTDSMQEKAWDALDCEVPIGELDQETAAKLITWIKGQ